MADVNGGAMTTSVVDYKITARPNCSLSGTETAVVVAFIGLISLSVAIGFSLAGAWLVFPFAGLELLVVAYAFYYINCHAGDYESITIDGDHLAVEKRSYKKTSRVMFHRYWARVDLIETPGGGQRLRLRSHGKEVEFGRYLNNEQCAVLVQQLRRRTGAIYQ
jgi:uncharacterized membrane protein